MIWFFFPIFFKHYDCLGAKRHEVTDELLYLVQFGTQTEEIACSEAAKYWPQKVIQFLERRLEWYTVSHNSNADDNAPVEATGDITDDPKQILCVYQFFLLD